MCRSFTNRLTWGVMFWNNHDVRYRIVSVESTVVHAFHRQAILQAFYSPNGQQIPHLDWTAIYEPFTNGITSGFVFWNKFDVLYCLYFDSTWRSTVFYAFKREINLIGLYRSRTRLAKQETVISQQISNIFHQFDVLQQAPRIISFSFVIIHGRRQFLMRSTDKSIYRPINTEQYGQSNW